MRNKLCLTLTAAMLASTSACVKTIPSRSVPDRSLPVLRTEPAPPVEGTIRLALDVVDGPTKAELLLTESAGRGTAVGSGGAATVFTQGVTAEPVCHTPCVANIPFGNRTLLFARGTEYETRVEVVAGSKPSVVNVALGRVQPTGAGTGAVGTALIIVGGALALAGLAVLPVDEGSGIPVPLILGGAAGAGLGALLFNLDPTIVQKGSSVQWEPENGRIYRR